MDSMMFPNLRIDVNGPINMEYSACQGCSLIRRIVKNTMSSAIPIANTDFRISNLILLLLSNFFHPLFLKSQHVQAQLFFCYLAAVLKVCHNLTFAHHQNAVRQYHNFI